MSNPWLDHLKAFHKAHPKLTYKQAMRAARPSYKTIGKPKKTRGVRKSRKTHKARKSRKSKKTHKARKSRKSRKSRN